MISEVLNYNSTLTEVNLNGDEKKDNLEKKKKKKEVKVKMNREQSGR